MIRLYDFDEVRPEDILNRDIRAEANVEAAVDAKLAAGSVNRFLSQLDKKDCAVFLSRYYYSLTIAEIADKLGLTERNVKYRLSCLRQKLRRQLEKEGISV